MDGYPTWPSGSGRFFTNRWHLPPAGFYVARRVGFSRITVPTKYDVTAQLTVGISRENLSMKACRLSIDGAGRRQYALVPTPAAD